MLETEEEMEEEIKTYSHLFSYKAYLLLIGFILLFTQLNAQDQRKADSLIQVLKTQQVLEDTLKLEILRSICASDSNPEIRLKYAKEAYNLAESIDNTLWLYRSAIEIGHAYKRKGDLEKAADAFFKSVKFAEKINYKKGEAIAYSAIGNLYRIQNNYSTALSYYNLGIDKLRELKDSVNLAKSLMNTGELYRTNHILDTALVYFYESGRIFFKLNYEIGNAYNLGNIGLVFAERGDDELAERNLLEATQILEKLGDRYPIAVYNTYMADIYVERNDFKKALEYGQKSYTIAVDNGMKEQIRDASLKLSELYEIDKDYENAFKYQKKYIAYRDSLNNEETIRKMADLRTEFEVAQKQAEVDLLSQKQKTYSIIGAALVVLLVMLAALAWNFQKRNLEKLRSNKLLTEQKQKLEEQRAELEKLNNTKDRFFSIISHDLRGPVNAFKGLSSIIKFSVEEKEYDQLPEIVERINSSSAQLSLLLDNLLDWAVNQQGKFPYDPEKIEVSELFNKVSGVFQNMAEFKGIELQKNLRDDLHIWADRNSVRAILRNLVNNSIKFTPKGGKITLGAEYDNGFVKLSVKDTGIGISDEKLRSLNQLKEEKSTTGTEGEKGLGLGLRLVFEFAEMNNGHVKVESHEGEGSTFTISLPHKA